MARVRVSGFSISLDGHGAGPAQSEQHPLGVRGDELHQWMFPPPTFKAADRGPVDAGLVARDMDGLGAWIMGRNSSMPSSVSLSCRIWAVPVDSWGRENWSCRVYRT